VRVRVSLFFDGTFNNRTKAELGTEHSSDASYDASVTNVGLLESIGIDQ
jgi:hypothetical protein